MLKKIFGGLRLTWPRVIAFAAAAGVFTALMAMLAPEGSSFHEIAVQLEAWILFAILIISNSDSPKEAALKTFVFFLISQPLVYLLQVPFSWMGWGLFRYYGYWFILTLLTLPGAYIGWYIKKDTVLSALILSVMLVLLILLGMGYLRDMLRRFPAHLLSTVFCFGLVPVFILGILRSKRARLTAAAVSIAAAVAAGVMTFSGPPQAENRLIAELSDKYPLDETWTVRVESGSAEAVIEPLGDEYVLMMYFTKTGENTVVLTDGAGSSVRASVTFDKDGAVTVKELGG